MSFWHQFDDENQANDSKLPPLTDELVQSLEALYGIKFPKRLIELLRERNGGCLASNDFKFEGKDYQIDSISGLAPPDKWGNIKPIDRIYNLQEEEDLRRQLKAKIGRPELILPFGDFGGHCLYALDYNRKSRKGEPKIVYFVMEGDVSGVRTIAENFEDFLKGQDLGEENPSVNLDEAAREKVVLETKATGQHKQGGVLLGFSHWVCERKKELVIYTKSTWNEKVSFRKATILKRSLEPDFCEITKLEYAADPGIHVLRLHVNPRRQAVSVEDSEQNGKLWKNTKAELLYDSVHATDREKLVRLRKQLFPDYRGKPRSLTKQLNGLLKELGVIGD